jgi:hypothetical protein
MISIFVFGPLILLEIQNTQRAFAAANLLGLGLTLFAYSHIKKNKIYFLISFVFLLLSAIMRPDFIFYLGIPFLYLLIKNINNNFIKHFFYISIWGLLTLIIWLYITELSLKNSLFPVTTDICFYLPLSFLIWIKKFRNLFLKTSYLIYC